MLKQRVITALIAGVTFITLNVFAGDGLWMVCWAVLITLAAHETTQLIPIHGRAKAGFIGVNALLACVGLAVGLYRPAGFTPVLHGVAWVAALLWLGVVPWQLRVFARSGALSVSVVALATINALFLLGFAFAVALNWRLLGGVGLLGLFVLVWCSDIGAYFAGKRFGRHKLAPAISPNKTREGFIGGWLLSLFAVLIYALWVDLPVSMLAFMAVSAFVLGFATIGDLWESALKRQAGVKDSGRILPGHGGVLDRIDSWLPSLLFWALLFG